MKLSKQLTRLFQLPAAPADRFVLLVCFGIALLLWLIVKLEGNFSKEIEVQLSYILPEDQAFLELPPSSLQATVKGEGWTLIQPERKINLPIELTDDNRRFIDRAFLENEVSKRLRFQSLIVSRVIPEYFNLETEEKISRKVPVQLRDSISVAAEHFVKDEIVISPDSVLISGPSSIVNGLEYWTTQLVRKTDVNASIKDSIALTVDKSGVLELHSSSVQVEIPVERYAEKSFFVPVTVAHDFDSLTIFPNKIRLNVVVGLSDFNSISEKDFILEADLKTATRTGDDNTAPLLITKKPLSVKNIYFSPKAVEFFIVETNKDSLR